MTEMAFTGAKLGSRKKDGTSKKNTTSLTRGIKKVVQKVKFKPKVKMWNSKKWNFATTYRFKTPIKAESWPITYGKRPNEKTPKTIREFSGGRLCNFKESKDCKEFAFESLRKKSYFVIKEITKK